MASMSEIMVGIKVSITRYLGDDPQPGIVECEFTDVHGRVVRCIDKTPIVSKEDLDADSSYPRPGVIGCEVTGRRRDESGGDIILVDTTRPWSVESVDGVTQFEVRPASLVKWEWGSDNEEPWAAEGNN
jgi:hypothetical protein